MSEYAEGYLDGVVDSSTGDTDFSAVEGTFINRAYDKMFTLLKAEKHNAEMNLCVEGQSEQYYTTQHNIIKAISKMVVLLKPQYYVEVEKRLVESFFLGFNQGIFDGREDSVNMVNIFDHVDILDGVKMFITDGSFPLRNTDYLAGYYCGVMDGAPMDVVVKIEHLIVEHKKTSLFLQLAQQ